MREKDKNRQRERREAGGGRDMKKLKKGKTYYFKVRAYKKVAGKKVYTGYSNIVKVKIKK